MRAMQNNSIRNKKGFTLRVMQNNSIRNKKGFTLRVMQNNSIRNKKGFTLIELMASVAILALIVSPLIHSFLSSAVTAKKSHTTGDLMLASGNIIETIKAREVREIVAWTSKPIPQNPFGETVSGYEPSYIFDEDANIHTIELYRYSAGMSTFDVRLKIEGSNDVFAEVNKKLIPNYSPMDGIFAQPHGENNEQDPDKIAIAEFTSRVGRTVFPSEIQRKITLNVSKNDARNEVRVTAVYEYKFLSYDYKSEYEFYRGKETTEYKSLYLCYMPSEIQDNIVINNNVGANLKFFLVNQNIIDGSYIIRIELNEKHDVNLVDLEDSKAKIFSNSKYSLQVNFPFATPSYDSNDFSLVEQSPQERLYKITVEVYAKDVLKNNSGEKPLLVTEAAQLD